jgi:hypothetical protein
MMGVGQVVTLRLPASRLREVNRILENTAWGSYRTEFYPTCDSRRSAPRRTRRRNKAALNSSDPPPTDQPSLEICSSVTTRSIFSVLLLIR